MRDGKRDGFRDGLTEEGALVGEVEQKILQRKASQVACGLQHWLDCVQPNCESERKQRELAEKLE